MKKFLRIVIFLLIILALIAVVLMAVAPKHLNIEQTQTIEAPPKMIYNMVNDFEKWEAWSPWMEMDPEAKNSYTDKTSGVGAQWNWDGEELGKGNQKIVESISGEKITTELVIDGWDGISRSHWNFDGDDKKTKVTWDLRGSETPFIFRPFNLFMKSGMKKTYAQGLAKLKKIVEKRANEKIYGGYKISEVTLDEKHYIMNRSEIPQSQMQQFYTANLGSLFMKAQGAKMEMDGMPSGLFYSWDNANDKTDMAAAIPLKESLSLKGASSTTLPAGRAVQVDYYGDYTKIESAHNAVEDYLNDYGLLVNYPVVQEYVTDPMEEKDPSKWLTKVTYYISE